MPRARPRIEKSRDRFRLADRRQQVAEQLARERALALELARDDREGRKRADWAEARKQACDIARRGAVTAWTVRAEDARAGRDAFGMVLTLGGAPATWHEVSGLPGRYHPHDPAGVGQPGEIALDRARAADADAGCPVRLVPLNESTCRRRALHAGQLTDKEVPRELESAFIHALAPLVDLSTAERSRKRDEQRSAQLWRDPLDGAAGATTSPAATPSSL